MHRLIRIVLTEQEIAEFYSLVVKGKAKDCWEWLGEAREDGYPRFKRRFLSHRVAYALAHDLKELDGKVIHSCENLRCCNPNHLVYFGLELRGKISMFRSLGLTGEEIAQKLKLPTHVITRMTQTKGQIYK